jgi:hypothetical protein
MDIIEVLDQFRELLRHKRRVTYGILKRQFALDDDALEDVKAELIKADRVARDEDGEVLVWIGDAGTVSQTTDSSASGTPSARPSHTPSPQPEQKVPAGERRQLTVVFCDLVGSTALSEQLDPEEFQTVVRTYQEISAATQRLVTGLFETEDRGHHKLKGISIPQSLYRVIAESSAQSRFAVAVQAGLTPLVGREHELGVLRERWTQAQAGNGQAILVSGEPGIGKSRLVQELKGQVTAEGATQIELRCSPYHQNTALHPITEHLQRLLQFTPDDTSESKLAKLQLLLDRYRFPQTDTLPLLAALLSLPHPEGTPPLTASPQKQKDLTHAALVAWLIEETEQQPVYASWEDLHWADPSTLEVLEILLNQVPTSRLLAVLTFRPEFIPPWGTHSYLSQLTLSRLGHPQVSAMVERVTGGKTLPEEVLKQIVTKTDGVPLFVEELTKMVIESSFVREE